jgi:hypothetical protein
MSTQNSRDARHAISTLFSFALFALFAVLMLLMVVISAQGYKKTVERGEQTANIRTALGYIEGRVLSGASRDGLRVEKVDGLDVLFLSMIEEDEEEELAILLETAIYCYDGMLMEQFYDTGELEFDIEDGQELIRIEALELSLDNDGRLLHVYVRGTGGKEQSLRIALVPPGEVDR